MSEGRDEKGNTPTWDDWFDTSRKIKIALFELELELIKQKWQHQRVIYTH